MPRYRTLHVDNLAIGKRWPINCKSEKEPENDLDVSGQISQSVFVEKTL